MFPFQLLIAVPGGWLYSERADVIAFLREENRLLKARLAGDALRVDDGERRRRAELGHRLGRRLLAQAATIVTPDTVDRDPKWSGGWSVGWPRRASAWFAHHRVRRPATRTPSGSSAQ